MEWKRTDGSDSPLLLSQSPKLNRKIKGSSPILWNIFLVLVVTTIASIYIIQWESDNFLRKPPPESTWRKVFPAKPEFCRIPYIPIWTDSYLQEASERSTKISQCGHGSKFTEFVDDTRLKLVHWEVRNKENCTVFQIERPMNCLNDTFTSRSNAFDTSNEVKSLGSSEHIIISCNVHDKMFFDYHSRVLPMRKDSLGHKIKYWKTKSKNEIPVNVMVLVLDSTSTTDAFRQLPMTMKYLLEDLNFIQFNHYHALGEPTMLNVIPLLVGTPTATFFQTKTWYERWDDTEFIWKHFNRSYFATAYMEDLPRSGTFNYRNQTGFLFPPTDFYTRPFFSAWEALGGKSEGNCIGSTSIWNYLYNYELEILRKLNGLVPSFTMPWLCWPFHDKFDTLSAIDPGTLSFFQKLEASEDILENTVIILMGDHGFYGSEYGRTHEGLLERRLPLFLFRVPQKLSKFVPNVKKIVEHNSKHVTSHYDTFKTLLHLASLGKNEGELISNRLNSGLGRSLLELLPKDRSCEDAGIPEQWCACNLTDMPLGGIFRDWIPERIQLYPEENYVDRTKRM